MIVLIIKIVLIILILRILVLEAVHLGFVFWDHGTQVAVDKILEDPHKYVREEHICKFMYNMIWILLFIKLLYAAFTGHITINT